MMFETLCSSNISGLLGRSAGKGNSDVQKADAGMIALSIPIR